MGYLHRMANEDALLANCVWYVGSGSQDRPFRHFNAMKSGVNLEPHQVKLLSQCESDEDNLIIFTKEFEDCAGYDHKTIESVIIDRLKFCSFTKFTNQNRGIFLRDIPLNDLNRLSIVLIDQIVNYPDDIRIFDHQSDTKSIIDVNVDYYHAFDWRSAS